MPTRGCSIDSVTGAPAERSGNALAIALHARMITSRSWPMKPTVSKLGASAVTPTVDTRPKLGLNPATPQ